PDRVRRREAAAEVARIDDVVVEEGRGVDELDRRREPDRPVAAVIAAEPRRREGQHRSEALAAGSDDVAGELRDEGDRALHALDDARVDALHVLAEEADETVEARLRARRQGRRRFA